jgi:hypothetical protein
MGTEGKATSLISKNQLPLARSLEEAAVRQGTLKNPPVFIQQSHDERKESAPLGGIQGALLRKEAKALISAIHEERGKDVESETPTEEEDDDPEKPPVDDDPHFEENERKERLRPNKKQKEGKKKKSQQ